MKFWTEDKIEFLRSIHEGRNNKILAEVCSWEFGKAITPGAMQTVLNRNFGNRKPKVWTPEKLDYLREIVPGKPVDEITRLFNERFGTDYEWTTIKGAMGNHHIRSGYRYDGYKHLLFTKEQIEWLKENRWGYSFEETAAKMNERFGTNFKVSQVRGWCHTHHLPNGMDMKFKKGQVSFNKGKKGYCAPGCEKGWFKKGHRPSNWVPVNTEVVVKDGYIKIKVAEPNKWELKHRVIWMNKHGEIPAGQCLIFLNGDKTDCRIENLMLIERGILSILNHEKLLTGDAAANKCAVTMARIKSRIRELEAR